MNCVHDAFVAHCHALQVEPRNSFFHYQRMKQATHHNPNQYTFGGALPFMIGFLASWYGMEAEVQHHLWTPEHYAAVAPTPELAKVSIDANWGNRVDKITLAPAIYAMHYNVHAHFGKTPPHKYDLITIAVQLKRTNENTR